MSLKKLWLLLLVSCTSSGNPAVDTVLYVDPTAKCVSISNYAARCELTNGLKVFCAIDQSKGFNCSSLTQGPAKPQTQAPTQPQVQVQPAPAPAPAPAPTPTPAAPATP